ncbi:hypothetical protein HanRHA438_Chr02g0087461 [Helianthus annuus]|nr:hypothetical protein HanRHA438_Chr02g0087461 [Helianthus annuus]
MSQIFHINNKNMNQLFLKLTILLTLYYFFLTYMTLLVTNHPMMKRGVQMILVMVMISNQMCHLGL